MKGVPNTWPTGSDIRRTNSGAGRVRGRLRDLRPRRDRPGERPALTKFDEAPLAYLLSAMAGLIYIVATITLALGTRASCRVALVAIIVELVGVVSIGTLSVVDPAAFPRATVWSTYGIGHGSFRWCCRFSGWPGLVHQDPLTLGVRASRLESAAAVVARRVKSASAPSSVRRCAISDAHVHQSVD